MTHAVPPPLHLARGHFYNLFSQFKKATAFAKSWCKTYSRWRNQGDRVHRKATGALSFLVLNLLHYPSTSHNTLDHTSNRNMLGNLKVYVNTSIFVLWWSCYPCYFISTHHMKHFITWDRNMLDNTNFYGNTFIVEGLVALDTLYYSPSCVTFYRLKQEYLNALSYNHTGTQLFDIKPHSSMITLMETARIMVMMQLEYRKCMGNHVKKQHLEWPNEKLLENKTLE